MPVKEDVRMQAGKCHRGNQPMRKTFRRPAEDTVGKGIAPRRRTSVSAQTHPGTPFFWCQVSCPPSRQPSPCLLVTTVQRSHVNLSFLSAEKTPLLFI